MYIHRFIYLAIYLILKRKYNDSKQYNKGDIEYDNED